MHFVKERRLTPRGTGTQHNADGGQQIIHTVHQLNVVLWVVWAETTQTFAYAWKRRKADVWNMPAWEWIERHVYVCDKDSKLQVEHLDRGCGMLL